MSVPSPPRFDASGIRPVCSDQTLEFYWAPPSSADQTGYTLSCPTDPSSPYTFAANIGYTKITGLTNGQEYVYQITADNGNGSSAPAFYRSVQPGFKPGQPSISSTQFLNNGSNAIVSFTPAASNGGATIKWYLARALSTDPSDPVVKDNCEGFRSTISLTGLNPVSQYNFYVNAVNDPGYGPQISTGVYYTLVKNGLLLDLESSNYSGGSNWNDSSSNGNNASLQAGTGQIYRGYTYFNGSNYFTAPNLGTLSNWTVSIWIMPLEGYNDYVTYLGEDLRAGSGPNYAIMTGASYLGFSYPGYTAVGWMNDGTISPTYNPNVSPTIVPSNSTWNNVVGTFNGSNITMYLNGSNVGCNTYTNLAPATNSQPIAIGRNCKNSLFGQGLIYNRALSAAEVSRNYLATYNNYLPFNPPYISNILIWLDMADTTSYTVNSGNITTMSDKSINGYILNELPPSGGFTSILPVPGTSINNLNTAYFSAPAGIKMTTQLNGVTDFFWVGRQYAQNNPTFLLGDNTYSDWFGTTNTYIFSSVAPAGIANASTTIFYNNISTTQAFKDTSVVATSTIFMISAHGITGNTRFQGLCYDRDQYQGWIGDFGELICYNSALTSNQITSIENYLRNKWSI